MKRINIFKYFIIILFIIISCDEFLDKTPEAEVTEQEVFGTYPSMQGFLDHNYSYLMCYMKTYLAYTMYKGGECFKELYRSESRVLVEGNYWLVLGPNTTDHYWNTAGGYGGGLIPDTDYGIWAGGWKGIRKANITLSKLPLMVDATEEERRLIEGQALFFRAYFHGDIMKSFGGMPYLDTVYSASDEMKLPRLTYQECTDKLVRDLDRAIELLPEDWDLTGPGSQRIGANRGRITKGTALAYKQKYLLYAGSPTMNAYSGNDYTYNIDYCKRAADAGWEMIKLADKGIYRLMPWDEYYKNFHNNNVANQIVYCDETILERIDNRFGTGQSYNFMRRQFLPGYLGGASLWQRTANQKFVDFFEMSDGTRYKEEYDQDDNKRWKNRDPRFYYNFYVDRDKVGNNARSVWKGYFQPGDIEARPANNAQTPYLIKKFVPWNANTFDRAYTNLQCVMPLMRLAQVYLDYAEAVTAAYGPNGSAPGSNLTAVDAINIIRARAGMPPVTSEAEGYDSFMDLVRNERTVELAFEAHYWFDIRRWHVAHLPEYKELITLDFDKDWTYFNRRRWNTKTFDEKHYWLPIYRDQVQLYEGFYQNPGWD